MNKKENIDYQDQIEGRNAILEFLKSGKDINKIYIAAGEKHGSINEIIAKAKERKIVLVEVDKLKLNKMSQTDNCQGVIAIVPPFDYCDVDDILNSVKQKKPINIIPRRNKLNISISNSCGDKKYKGRNINTVETYNGLITNLRKAFF